jgi:formate dehydrogenase
MHCGVVATLHDGRLEKVEGDLQSRTRGFICEHGFALRELVHSGERLKHPLVRRGDTFHEVSWDEALREIGTRLGALKAKHGAETLAPSTTAAAMPSTDEAPARVDILAALSSSRSMLSSSTASMDACSSRRSGCVAVRRSHRLASSASNVMYTGPSTRAE